MTSTEQLKFARMNLRHSMLGEFEVSMVDVDHPTAAALTSTLVDAAVFFEVIPLHEDVFRVQVRSTDEDLLREVLTISA